MASARPRVFLDISIGTEPVGRLTFELFNDKAPKTCDNFRALCTGSHPPLSYKMSRFHRVIDEFMVQGGDITKGDGTGGESIYGGEFEDENSNWRDIDSPGLLCMANRGKATNSSQFFITLASCTHLNGKHTVFGHLASGRDALERIARTPVDDSDKPTTDVIVSHCGELERKKKTLADSSRLRPTKRASYTSNASLDSQSSDRGRAKRRRRSPDPDPQSATQASRSHSHSRSASPSRHSKQAKHRQPSQSPPVSPSHAGKVSTPRRSRRSSDHSVDETLRGRQRCRPDERMRMSPAIEEDSASPPPVNNDRRRSPSPSRHRERSHSTGFRRRRSLPNHYERRREDSRSRYERDNDNDNDHEMELDEVGHRHVESRPGKERASESWRPSYRDTKHRDDGRLGYDNGDYGGYGGSGSGNGGIRFKGRGSMKYRERH